MSEEEKESIEAWEADSGASMLSLSRPIPGHDVRVKGVLDGLKGKLKSEKSLFHFPFGIHLEGWSRHHYGQPYPSKLVEAENS